MHRFNYSPKEFLKEDKFLNLSSPGDRGLKVFKIRGRVETQPRFKIQYPMKNHNKDAQLGPKRCMI